MVADGLAGTGIPMGIVPEGTANLLSRNLDIPQNELEAIAVALTGQTRPIDLVKISVDGSEGEHFAVMAGMGIDAMIMDETDPELKAKIGTGAYSWPPPRRWAGCRCRCGSRSTTIGFTGAGR